MMEDDPDFGYYCETDDDGVTPVTTKKTDSCAIPFSYFYLSFSLF